MTLCTYRTHINRLTFPATLEELVPNIREFWRFSLHYKCSYRPAISKREEAIFQAPYSISSALWSSRGSKTCLVQSCCIKPCG